MLLVAWPVRAGHASSRIALALGRHEGTRISIQASALQGSSFAFRIGDARMRCFLLFPIMVSSRQCQPFSILAPALLLLPAYWKGSRREESPDEEL